MANTKPFVSLACVCEKALQEADKVLSLIRVVDTYYVPPTPPGLPPDIKPAVDVTVVVTLKSGDVVGSYEIGLALRPPIGAPAPEPKKWPIVFKGAEQGANAIVKFPVSTDVLGLYWFDVLWKGEVLTSIPFKLVAAPTPSVH
jgi:hypothetical protein